MASDRRTRMNTFALSALTELSVFSEYVVRKPLAAYQLEAGYGILQVMDSRPKNPQISVMMSRQAGKNELSAQLEAFLMNRFQRAGGQIVKVAPTFKPQIITSMQRLEECLDNFWNKGIWKQSFGYIRTLGKCKILFFSADPQSNVVGATASLLIEFDESQDIDRVKLRKDFLPMASRTNAPRVYYGTAWTDDTVLESVRQMNVELQKRDGVQRHFEFPWWRVAESLPAYGKFVEEQRDEMGADHPIFRTQYNLESIRAQGKLFSDEQLDKMDGMHRRCVAPPNSNYLYIAGVDIAGSSEMAEDEALRDIAPRKDSTVITVGRLVWPSSIEHLRKPRVEILQHYWWTGREHTTQYVQMLSLLQDLWRCHRIAVDNTGIGAGVADFLHNRMGDVVLKVDFTSSKKSELGFGLLAAVNTDRVKMYRDDGDESPEATEFWFEMEEAERKMGAFQKMSFFVPETKGHDDFLSSLALLVHAANDSISIPTVANEEVMTRGGGAERGSRRTS